MSICVHLCPFICEDSTFPSNNLEIIWKILIFAADRILSHIIIIIEYMRKFIFLLFVCLFCYAGCKMESSCEPITQMEQSSIDSIHVILMKEGIIFCTRENRSEFFRNYQNDSDGLFCDSLLVKSDEINELSRLLNELPVIDTLSYSSSQISYEMKKTGDVIRFIENSMDNRGVFLIYHRDNMEYVWLSENQIERGNFRYEMTDTIKQYIHKLNKLSADSVPVFNTFDEN